MLTQNIIVQSFLFSQVQHKFLFFAALNVLNQCFKSLDRIFSWLFNDVNLIYILQKPYLILPKNGSCVMQPLRGIV